VVGAIRRDGRGAPETLKIGVLPGMAAKSKRNARGSLKSEENRYTILQTARSQSWRRSATVGGVITWPSKRRIDALCLCGILPAGVWQRAKTYRAKRAARLVRQRKLGIHTHILVSHWHSCCRACACHLINRFTRNITSARHAGGAWRSMGSVPGGSSRRRGIQRESIRVPR